MAGIRYKQKDFEDMATGLSEIIGQKVYLVAIGPYFAFSTVNDTIAAQSNYLLLCRGSYNAQNAEIVRAYMHGLQRLPYRF